MGRIAVLAVVTLVALAGCSGGTGTDRSGIYRISNRQSAEVQYRMLDSINYLRQSTGAAPLQLDARLGAAAQSHADDMSRQQRPWGFGADGSNPYQRVQRAGYTGELLTEVYSQSYESELQTLTAWVDDQDWGPELLDQNATDVGIAWHQDQSGLIWWVMTLGRTGGFAPAI